MHFCSSPCDHFSSCLTYTWSIGVSSWLSRFIISLSLALFNFILKFSIPLIWLGSSFWYPLSIRKSRSGLETSNLKNSIFFFLACLILMLFLLFLDTPYLMLYFFLILCCALQFSVFLMNCPLVENNTATICCHFVFILEIQLSLFIVLCFLFPLHVSMSQWWWWQ